MGKFLIRYYPVPPAQHLDVHNLDVLYAEHYCSANYQSRTEELYKEYLFAINIFNKTNGSLVAYNNRWIGLYETERIDEAISLFLKELEEHIRKED